MAKTPIIASIMDMLPGVRKSLSIQLLTLTIIVVLLTEILIMIPSLATRQYAWLMNRSQAAYLVGLALKEDDHNDMMVEDILWSANIWGVTLNTGDQERLVLAPQIEQEQDRIRYEIDLNSYGFVQRIFDSWGVIFSNDRGLIKVYNRPGPDGSPIANIIVARQDLRDGLRIYARNILALSLLISAITALFVYWSLNNLIIRPVRRMHANMEWFEKDPENPRNILVASERVDEIGEAERGLSALEERLSQLLNERRRLAALGAGISKISHDLRNILASAQLMSDRLVKSDDPRVKKLSPRLVGALDRAITLSRETLNYGKISTQSLNLADISLRDVADDVIDDCASMHVDMENLISDQLVVRADRTQLYRSLTNLVRNGVDALTAHLDREENGDKGDTGSMDMGDKTASRPSIILRTIPDTENVIIEVVDNGPGLPEAAKEFLYEPFKGSQKPGGSGLGIAIAAEIMNAHGGKLVLHKSDEEGATFRLILPLRGKSGPSQYEKNTG